MIEEGEVAGFVDWSRAGVADRYKDIALVIGSIEFNTGSDLRRAFFDTYGVASPDAEKVEYYMLLDEFW
jgi:aminoglycoside phosphotransferase